MKAPVRAKAARKPAAKRPATPVAASTKLAAQAKQVVTARRSAPSSAKAKPVAKAGASAKTPAGSNKAPGGKAPVGKPSTRLAAPVAKASAAPKPASPAKSSASPGPALAKGASGKPAKEPQAVRPATASPPPVVPSPPAKQTAPAGPPTVAKTPDSKVVAKPVPKLSVTPKPAETAAAAVSPEAPVRSGLAETQSPAPVAPAPVAAPASAEGAQPAPKTEAGPDGPPAEDASDAPAGTPRREGPPALVKRPPSEPANFQAGDHVVYPTHGVGTVQGIETMSAAGYSLQVIVVTFDENRMTLRVPVGKAASSGLRKLASSDAMGEALDTLKGRARIKRTMWSRRAQEYEAKINSGDPVAIAEVVRDLHRNAGQPDQSFSERQIYEQALDRLAAELAAIDRTDKVAANEKLLQHLKAG